jgi:hypothetical protein
MERILLAQADSPDITGRGSFGSGGAGAADQGNIIKFNEYIFGYQESDGGGIFGTIFSSVRKMLADYKISGFETPGAFITSLFPILLSLGGLIFFVMLVIGSFQILMGGATPKSVEGGKKRITYALIGFLLLFASYWIGQIIQSVFGLNFGLANP